MTKHWLDTAYKSGNVIFMNRIRLERNVAGFNFPSKMSDEDFNILSHNLNNVIGYLDEDFEWIKLSEIGEKQTQALIEQYIISPELAMNLQHSEVYVSADGRTSIMLFEKNHITLSILSGNQTLSVMYKELAKLDEEMLKLYPAAYDERFMFLNANPKNAGIGIKISTLLHLPALSHTGKLETVLESHRSKSIKITNAYKIDDGASGDLFMVSFDEELAANPIDAIEKVELVTKEIAREEILMRNALKEDAEITVKDSIYKALGNIRYAYLLSLGEALDALSKIKLGMDMKYLSTGNLVVEELMIRSMPASLAQLYPDVSSKLDRDIRRAEYIKEALKEV